MKDLTRYEGVYPKYIVKVIQIIDTDGAYIYAFDQLPDPMPEGDSADNYTNSLTTPASGEITITLEPKEKNESIINKLLT